MIDRSQYLQRWSQLHGEVAPVGLVGGWLRLSYALARRLAVLQVRPGAVTVAGLGLALLVLPSAAGGGRWPLLAVATVILAALLDSLDGAVAILTDRVSRRGAVLDATCDRLADLSFITALWLVGAPAAACVVGGVVALLHEQVRAAARAAGMREVGVVTVSERPTRVIVTAAFLLGAGLYPDRADDWATAGVIGWVTVGIVGFVQLCLVVRRRLG
ncbi:MAG TPA: CDP-alcohol phosphatidyltransferase family protein [Kineosporiaceae bacterium]|nr:CDP-alcohol phosphatidyltransferase family protein [Kineosporiaceae bacterium]